MEIGYGLEQTVHGYSAKKYVGMGKPIGLAPGGLIGQSDPISGIQPIAWLELETSNVPLAHGNASSGIFSLAFRDEQYGMAVGGDYTKPDESTGTAPGPPTEASIGSQPRNRPTATAPL